MSAERDATRPGGAAGVIPTRLYPDLNPDEPALRVVLVVPRHSPRWIADLADLGHAGPSVFTTVIVIDGDWPSDPPPLLPLDMRMYLALERLRHRAIGDRLTRVDLGARACAQVRADDGAHATSAVVAVVSSTRPDLVLLDGPSEWHSALAGIARYGCWLIDSSLVDSRYAGLSLVAPVVAGTDASAIDLQLIDESGSSTALASNVGMTHPGWFRLQRDSAFAKLPAMLLRSLRQIARSELNLPGGSPSRLILRPGAPFRLGQGARALLTTVLYTARWQIQKRQHEDLWMLLLRHAKQALDPSNPHIDGGALLVAPATDYWADPCVVEHDGQHLIFAEEYPLRTRKAVIICLRMLADGRAQRLGIALDEPGHLSYPQPFQWQGQWYLTVESGSARCVRLYRASDFPLRWQPVTDLIRDRVCVDPTLHHHDGNWYLFVNVSESGGSTSEELFLFVSDQLTGPFRPHPANPIISDVRRSRPAGRLFEYHGRLIRPAQDCAASYGSAIVFSEVLELSPQRYREQPLARLDGSWSKTLDGCHTYSAISSLEVFDARGKVPAGMRQIPIVHASVAERSNEREIPLVSIIMVVGEDVVRLDQAIDDVLAQGFCDHEIILVCNDAAAVAMDVGRYVVDRPDRIRIVPVASRSQAHMYDAAMAQARGRYLAWYDMRYRWVEQHLEVCIDRLERDAALGMVHAQLLAPASSSDLFGQPLARARVPQRVVDCYAALLLWQTHPVLAAVVVRRSATQAVGCFDARFACLAHSERDYWLRIATIADIGEITSGHVTPVAPRSRQDISDTVMWDSRRMLIEKHADTRRGSALRRRAVNALDADQTLQHAARVGYWRSVAAFALSLRRHPWQLRGWCDMLRGLFRLPMTNKGRLQ